MSRFAEVVVLARGAELVMEPFTRPDAGREWHERFQSIDDSTFAGRGAGSSECYMWVIQFERRNWKSLLATLGSLPWPDPYSVQVLIHDEEDDCFGLWMIYAGKLVEVPIPLTVRRSYSPSPTGVLVRTDRA